MPDRVTPRAQPDAAPVSGARLMSPRKALMLAALAAVLEVVLILPFVDTLAGDNSTVHFTQHGGIFLGGVLMGIALRDMYLASQP